MTAVAYLLTRDGKEYLAEINAELMPDRGDFLEIASKKYRVISRTWVTRLAQDGLGVSNIRYVELECVEP